MAVAHHLARSVGSHEELVIFQFDTRSSDHVARAIQLELRLVQHVLADFTDIADQVRQKPFARVQPAIGHNAVQFWQLVFVRLNERLFIHRDVFFEVDRLVLWHPYKVANFFAHFLRVHVQAFGYLRCISFDITRRVAH